MSKHIFPILLDGAKQSIGNVASATWNGTTSFVEYNRSTGGTIVMPLKNDKGADWDYGTIVKIQAIAGTQTTPINVSVNASVLVSLSTVGQYVTLVYTVDGTWVVLA